MAKSERYSAQQRGHGGHHDGAEAQETGLINGIVGSFSLFALGFQRKVNHHDGVLLHDADEQDDADDGHDGQFLFANHQRQQSAHAGRWQGGKDGNGVNITFVETPSTM